MNPRAFHHRGSWRRLAFLTWGVLWIGLADPAWSADQNESTEAIFAVPRHGYQRTRLADGTYRAETYTFDKGEVWGGEIADSSIDRMTFADVTKAIAGPLAGQNYVPSRDASSAQLRIVVSWGTTRAPEYRYMSNTYALLEDGESRNQGPNDALSAAVSGQVNTVWGLGSMGPSALIAAMKSSALRGGALLALDVDSRMWKELVGNNAKMLGYPTMNDAELQRFRYFVVLLAYDNHPPPGTKPRLLWEARISISQHHNRFDAQLAAMMSRAAPYFGQNSSGLIHQDVPQGHVEIGEVRSLDDVSAFVTAALSPDGARVAFLHDARLGRRIVIVDLDHPDSPVFGDVPNLGAVPVDFAWSDPTHVGVSLSSNASFTFDSAGHRSDIWTPPARVKPAADGGEITAAVTAKFPHRTVTLRGWDQAGQRFLYEVAGGRGGTRYYVYDRPTDVLVDLGWAPKLL